MGIRASLKYAATYDSNMQRHLHNMEKLAMDDFQSSEILQFHRNNSFEDN